MEREWSKKDQTGYDDDDDGFFFSSFSLRRKVGWGSNVFHTFLFSFFFFLSWPSKRNLRRKPQPRKQKQKKQDVNLAVFRGS